ncbi:hypothetical protein GCM10023208_08090 [Erythrobacter westpacificensis]|uniref:Uncharacterized protein n=1 Tax=Erythrobacter westpacificensis TaxID=1055231 RepID=A0ABP9K230_9SPHN
MPNVLTTDTKFDQAMIDCGVRDAQSRSLEILRRDGLRHWENSYEGEEAREDLGFSLATNRKLSGDPDPDDVPRGYDLELRSYATRDYVYAVVSRWASWYYQVQISPRRVRACWGEYRRFQRET